jgi:hypothetical protein
MAVVMKLLENDSGSASTERMSGGYQVVASTLTKMFPDRPTVSRQLVWLWWSRRARTHVPEGWERPTANGSVRRFFLDEVVEWYRGHRLDEEGAA